MAFTGNIKSFKPVIVSIKGDQTAENLVCHRVLWHKSEFAKFNNCKPETAERKREPSPLPVQRGNSFLKNVRDYGGDAAVRECFDSAQLKGGALGLNLRH